MTDSASSSGYEYFGLENSPWTSVANSLADSTTIEPASASIGAVTSAAFEAVEAAVFASRCSDFFHSLLLDSSESCRNGLECVRFLCLVFRAAAPAAAADRTGSTKLEDDEPSVAAAATLALREPNAPLVRNDTFR